MKVIFMGTPDFAVPAFRKILDAGHEVSLVVTQPDRPKGRGNELAASPVKLAALEAQVPVFQPARLREDGVYDRLASEEADLFVVAAFGQILPKEVLDLPRLCCINIHASLLPKYRGASPIQWAVLSGDQESGVTIQKMAEGLDTGDVICQERIPLDRKETAGSLFEKLSVLGADLVVKAMKSLEEGSAVFTPQVEALATKTGKISKDLGKLDFHRSAEELERLIRAVNPWPTAYTTHKGKLLKIWDADVVDGDPAPGKVLVSDKHSLVIGTGHGALSITEVQAEGKKRMPVADFLRGADIAPGESLG